MPNVTQLKRLGKLIREMREAEGWSLKELSERSGVGYSYASNIERGYVNPKRGPVTPSDDILFALAQTLRLPISKLHATLGRMDAEESPKQPEAQSVLDSIKMLLSEPQDYLKRVGENIDVSAIYNVPLSPLQASAGELTMARGNDKEYETLREVMPHQTRAIRVTGECMSPYYHTGDILLVRETPFAENGQKVIALVDGESLSCKVFRTNGTNYLEPLNGEERIPGDRFRIIGVIIKLIRDA